MPEATFLDAVQPLTDREQNKIHAPTDLWSDAFALKVAVQDFDRAEAYRTQNCDWRWRNANELYQAWVQQKYWEGTKIPRASIGVFVAFEQIESMLPKLLGAIFSENPWFHADPLFQTTAEQARGWQALILDQLDKTRVREIYRRAIKSGLMYGNGIVKLSWKLRQYEELEWLPRMQPNMTVRGGRPQISGFKRVIDKRTVNRIENRPELEYVSLNDFYIDPNCFSPQVADAQYCVQRKLVSIEDLAALRDLKEFNIPSDDALIQMAKYKPSTNADATKSTAELFRMGFWSPQIDQSVDPALARIELLEYWRDDRIVWVLNRNHAALNMPNSYGFKPFYDAFYADVLDRFYAMGVCDVVEGEQRLQAALLNGRLDELSLSLHRPLVKKLGVKQPQYALRVKPGQMWESEDPKNDFIFMDIPNITANAYIETQGSEMRVQKTTGVTDLAVLGTPSSGGNSAARTATGVGVQAQASASRLQYLVENLEDTFIEPMLNDIVKLNQMFPPIGTSLTDTVAMSRVQLTMRASAKMQSKMSLMQTFPLVFQALTNGPFISQLQMQGVTVDWQELMNILIDMTGYRNRADLIRPLKPEEMERMNQPPAEEMIRMQMQKERIQGQAQIQDRKLQAQMQLAGMKQESTDQTEDNYALIELAKAIMQTATAQDKAQKPA